MGKIATPKLNDLTSSQSHPTQAAIGYPKENIKLRNLTRFGLPAPL
ncbi:MAG: hypothetical protein KME16_24780 [Scytolyngbya sp. HA4215-MV1]|nr:hypothetical protein [Scytolyngbya sp. HA4215-MV1]